MLKTAMHQGLIFLIIITLCPTTLAGIYKWVDDKGKIHYGDDAEAAKGGNNVSLVKLKDKYAIPQVQALTPIPYTKTKDGRTIVLKEVTLDVDHSDSLNVLVGRTVCGSPVDLYWKEGIIELDKETFSQPFISTVEAQGYLARVGTPIREAGELELSASIKQININRCSDTDKTRPTSQTRYASTSKRRSKDDTSNVKSKNSTYLKVEWTLVDPLTGGRLIVHTTKGAHYGLTQHAVLKGTFLSINQSFEMAVTNLLSSEEFVKNIEPLEYDVIGNDQGEALSLPLKYDNNVKSFEDNAETLRDSTVIVKTKSGHGSGVFIADGGYILTNAHVIGDETTISVLTANEIELSVDVVSVNELRDVALLKVNDTELNKLPPAVSIAPTMPNMGSALFVIGTPLDLKFSHSITQGILSAKRKMRGLTYFQTDAAINHGNSGGPAFNKKGELVAITVSGVMTNHGTSLNINYLIPIDDALLKLNIFPLDLVSNEQENPLTATEEETTTEPLQNKPLVNPETKQPSRFLRLWTWLSDI